MLEVFRLPLLIVGGLLLTVIGMAPPLTYLLRGLQVRRKQIVNNFDPKTVRFYFARFWVTRQVVLDRVPTPVRNLVPANPEQAAVLVRCLDDIFEEHFGQKLFWMPVALLATVLMISSVLTLHDLAQSGFAAPAAAAAATGGYLWVVSDGIRRMRLNDYLPSDVYDHVLRITIAVPLGLALASVAKDAVGPLVAFSAGTFPIGALSRVLRGVVAKATGATDDVDTDGDEIKRLIGINDDVAHRLMSEGVATILALCKCDPIRIMMRTNLDFEVVLDLMDQALVAAYLTPSDRKRADELLDVLRQSGLARATQVAPFAKALTDNDAAAGELMVSLSEATHMTECQFHGVVSAVASDERTKLVTQLKYFEEIA